MRIPSLQPTTRDNPSSAIRKSWAYPFALVLALLALLIQSASAIPIITTVVETGGDNEATDTVSAKWTGVTFTNGVADEPVVGRLPGDPYTVGVFGNHAPNFVDRNHRYTNASDTVPIPSYLAGAEYIMSGNDNRENPGYLLDVTVSVPVRVYLLIDNRLNDTVNTTPPTFTPTNMQWVVDEGWTPVRTGANRTTNSALPDEVAIDESADGTLNQWFSVYTRPFNVGTFRLKQADNAGQNMYGVVVTQRRLAIGLNFGADEVTNSNSGSLFGTNSAGVVVQRNWNDLPLNNGSVSGLVADANGTPSVTAASVTWTSPNTWSTTGRGEENNGFPPGANRTLMTGYIDTSDQAAGAATVSVTGLGPEFTTGGYDVIVYALGGTSASRYGAYSIGTVTNILNSAANPTGFVLDAGVDNTDSGNYGVFKSLTGSSFTLIANAVTAFGNGFRAPINGVQIVAQNYRTNILSPTDPIILVNGVNDGDPDAGPPPGGETVDHAIDRVTQKYLNFLDLGSGFIVTPQLGFTRVTCIRLYTANDAEARDPASYLLEGSVGGPSGPWTVISSDSLSLPAGRNPGGAIPIDPATHFNQTLTFENTIAYNSYRVTFPTLKDAASANSMQIGEVELLGSLQPGIVQSDAIDLISFGNAWRYDQSGANLGTAWREVTYDDSAWPQGAGLLGLETSDPYPYPEPIRTALTVGTNKITYYFRTHFTFPPNTVGFTLIASNYVDDGAVFYLNGTEVGRIRMPDGVVDDQTLAANAPEGQVVVLTFSSASLVAGDNVLAVEVHQTAATRSDIVFGMSLSAIIQSNVTHKITVDSGDANASAQLASRGATNLASYGSFSLWSVTSSQAAGLLNRASVAIHYEFDAVPIRGGLQINTQTGEPGVPANLRQVRSNGFQFWLVHFAGPIKDAWLSELASNGLERVAYTPANAYILWGNSQSLSNLDLLATQRPFVVGIHAYHPYYRLEFSLQRAVSSRPPAEMVDVSVEVFRSPTVEQTLATLRAIGGQVRMQPSTVEKLTSISLQLPLGRLVEVANWNDVYNVEPWSRPVRLDEVQGHIVAGNVKSSGGNIVPLATSDLTYVTYRNWLLSKGFPITQANYPIVDVVDDGIDQGNAGAVLHPDFFEFGNIANPDRIVYIGNCTADTSGNGVAGHGNINAGIVGSYNNGNAAPFLDANGYRRGMGVSPFGRIAGTKIFGSGSWLTGCGGTHQGLVGSSYANGANLTSDSWGPMIPTGAYDTVSKAYDSLTRDASTATAGQQQMLHIFAAGNDGPSASSIGFGGAAKNTLVVGATENVRDHGTVDGSGISAANSADDIIGFSSRGPTSDGRKKPDIMAPGTHVQGPASQDPGFDGSSVSGQSGNDFVPPPTDAYYPAGGQTLYTWSSGTSHSCPAVAGAASLAYEHYQRVLTAGLTPSPAMLKALLLNSTRYLTGVSANDQLPSNNQGYGDVNLGRAFDGTPRIFVDQSVVFANTGDNNIINAAVYDPTKPLRVTLVWSDAPGNTTGNAWVNDLNLEVTVGASIYRGNVFTLTGGNSTTGGSADIRNNVENVFIPAGLSGNFTVRVLAGNIAGDGIPGNADTTDQDFVLVIYNGVQATTPAADVFMRDDPVLDDGTEPDPAAVDMWNSQDIWVRLTSAPDPTQTHESPEFGQINYVNVRLHNSGPNVAIPQAASGVVKLYWANGSSALTWPAYWNWFADIPVTISAGADLDVRAAWVPPGLGHHCLTAIWVSGQDPLAAPLNGDPNSNTRNNNNIAWRNVHVVDTLPDILSLARFIMRNPTTNAMRYDVRLRALPTDRRPFPDNFLDRGEIYFDLGPALYQRWVQAGGQGEGFQIVSNETGGVVFKALTAAGTYIRGIPFEGGEEFNVSMSFRTPVNQVRVFKVDATQMIGSNTPVGGMTYELRTKPNPDTDGDGIPDVWETAHGLDPNNPNDALLDFDGDGLTNLAENIAGTDPQDPLSFLRINRISLANGATAARIEFLAASNKTYTIEFRNSLSSGTWSPLANVGPVPVNQAVTFDDGLGGSTNRFYRLVTPRRAQF